MLAGSSIMHSHCVLSRVRPPEGDALGGTTGSVRIKSDGFATDILHILRREVCV